MAERPALISLRVQARRCQQAIEKRRRGRQDNTDGGPTKTAEKRSESRSTLRVVNEHFDWARTRGRF